jgi:ATP-dependent DNA helicase RecQ
MNLTNEVLKIILDSSGNNIFVLKTCNFDLFYNVLDELKSNDSFYIPNAIMKFNTYKELYNTTDKLSIDYLYNLKTKSIVILYEQLIQISEKIDLKIVNANILILNNDIERYKYLPINVDNIFNKIQNKNINEIEDDEEIDAVLEYYDEVTIESCGNTKRIVIDYKDNGILESLSAEEINIIDTSYKLEGKFKKFKDCLDNLDNNNVIYLAQDIEVQTKYKYFNRLESDCFINEVNKNPDCNVYIIANSEHFNSTPTYLKAWSRYVNNITFLEFESNEGIVYHDKYDIDSLLKKYWNSNTFKEYSIYDINKNKYGVKKISQKDILNQILMQYNNARRGKQWQDIFFIASTGAGKSLLYELPSIILNKEDMVTIVVSPLKALMKDQLQSMYDKGLTYATYINSDISFSEQIERLEGISNGKYSLLYVSPEFLQKYSSAKYIVGDRKIGLIVVDEAHCVSTWGKDFRSDYGYLGNYIKRYRKEMKFPILALTATAVWGGEFDTLNEIIKYLDFKPDPIIYYTDIKRTNIDIEIKNVDVPGNYRESKNKMTVDEIINIIKSKKKAIVYFPWKSQVKDIMIRLPQEIQSKVAIYTGDTKGEDGEEIIKKFKCNEYYVILATKAFGMGIDVPDIEIVYHHAIPGNLADYTQEIGRAARDQQIKGLAYTLYNPKDFQYCRILKGISRPTQWELKLIVDKLYEVFKFGRKKRQQKLLPLDTFAFVFNEKESDDIEQKIRAALFLIEKDFEQNFWNVINVYPRDEFGDYYCTLENGNKDEFISEYRDYVKDFCKVADNIRFIKDKRCICKDIGDILEIDLKKLWEEKYNNENFRSIKYKFFKDKLFNKYSVLPRTYIRIELQISKEKALERLELSLNIIKKALQQQEKFTRNELEKSIRDVSQNNYGCGDKEFINKIIHICTTFLYTEIGDTNYSHKMLLRKRGESNEYIYVASRLKASLGSQNIIKIFNNRFEDSEVFEKFIIPPFIGKSIYTCETMDLAYILQTLDLASFTIRGGHMPYVNIIVNSVDKLANAYYKNKLLSDMRIRDDNEIKVVEKFINTSKDKWDFIEDYFLGRLNI